MSETSRQKGERLFADGHVELVTREPGATIIAVVRGDHASYLATVIAPDLAVHFLPGVPRMTCTCPSYRLNPDRGMCSHLWAAGIAAGTAMIADEQAA